MEWLYIDNIKDTTHVLGWLKPKECLLQELDTELQQIIQFQRDVHQWKEENLIFQTMVELLNLKHLMQIYN